MIENSIWIQGGVAGFAVLTFAWRQYIRYRNRQAPRVPGKVYGAWTRKWFSVPYFVLLFGAPLELFFLTQQIVWPLSLMGFLCYLLAVWLRRRAVRALGKYWSQNVEIRKHHPVITVGPYRYIRHPNYLSLLLEVFGFAAVANAWIVAALMVILFVPVVIARIVIEEREMRKGLGRPYHRYQQVTKRLIPLVY